MAYSLENILSNVYNTSYGNNASTTALENQYGVNSNLTSAAGTVTGNLNSVLNSNSDYIRNARQAGVEQAATRGGVNSSIAAGASQRAAIESAGSLATQATQLQLQREQAATQLYLQQQNAASNLQDSIASSYVNSATGMLSNLQAAALADPETYTPEVISGYSNFFSKTMSNALSGLLG